MAKHGVTEPGPRQAARPKTRPRTGPNGQALFSDETSSRTLNPGGYSLWEYRGGAWALKTATCATGYVPGPPPVQAGRFEGELLKKHCEAAPDPAYPKTVTPRYGRKARV